MLQIKFVKTLYYACSLLVCSLKFANKHAVCCNIFSCCNLMVSPIGDIFWHPGVIFVSIFNKPDYSGAYILQED